MKKRKQQKKSAKRVYFHNGIAHPSSELHSQSSELAEVSSEDNRLLLAASHSVSTSVPLSERYMTTNDVLRGLRADSFPFCASSYNTLSSETPN